MTTVLGRPELERQWKDLYQQKLPSLAQQNCVSQRKWSVHLDHCFARIILDTIVGRNVIFSVDENWAEVMSAASPAPWTSKLKSPAIKNIEAADLSRCIDLGEAIAAGKVDLVHLDEESLKHRGKSRNLGCSGSTREADDGNRSQLKAAKPFHSKADIRRAFGMAVPMSKKPAAVKAELKGLILGSDLSDFRKRVLLALCQVPQGSVSSYLALSRFLSSSPRAVGNALRNNPYAPRVPCHRIVAADRSIGGFGGSWGKHGKHFKEKVELLKSEGVKVDGAGRIHTPIWEGFE